MNLKLCYSSILFVLLFLSCSKEDPNRKRTHGALPGSDSGAGCASAAYSYWETSDYVLPYSVGETYTVNLSHCSGSYHSAGQPDQFAIDFSMTIGTKITAAREGKVVHVEESGVDFQFPNNLVVVQHTDGTYAQYMHLTQNGAKVKLGQNIKQGQEIGLSGATGLAGYPHLHFVATKSGGWGYPYISFPTTFKNTSANEKSLLAYNQYTALEY